MFAVKEIPNPPEFTNLSCHRKRYENDKEGKKTTCNEVALVPN
jgi:hypothetical protein